MNDKYIYSELYKREFRVDFSGTITEASVENSLKIDTGAMKSLFPLKTLNYIDYTDEATPNMTEEEKNAYYKSLKLKFLSAGYNYSYMKGIERYESEEKKPIEERRDVVFYDTISKFNLNGYDLGKVSNITISCDTTGNCLLGMDILQYFDFYVGVSQITGKCTFIGCLRDRINDEYLTAILQHFGYLPRGYAEQTCINLRNQAYREGVHQGYIAGSWADYCTKNKEKKFFRRRGDVIR